jgi:prepilin-type processing-associated H-X9-DG protein
LTLVELLVVIGLIGLLAALLIPAVQAAREGARRAACSNNLRQLALSMHNYVDAVGCLPMGTPLMKYPGLGYTANHSIWVATLAELGDQQLFNSINFSTNIFDIGNDTVRRTAVATLWCPSDPGITATTIPTENIFGRIREDMPMCHASYAACAGTWYNFPSGKTAKVLKLIPPIVAAANGTSYLASRTRFADITDGLGTTLLIGERSYSQLDSAVAPDMFWWFNGYGTDTLFHTLNPINAWRVLDHRSGNIVHASNFAEAASSQHPGGANFAFADGSVRFLKETIDSWPCDPVTSLPLGITGDLNTLYMVMPGTRLGIYQALSTRNGGEVASGY